MPSPAALTLYAFGITAFIAGVASLLDPSTSSSRLDLATACAPAARANGLAAIAMGLYYALAAWQENAAFFAATVPMRLLTTVVFLAQGWTVPALWEGTGAVVTGLALLLSSSSSPTPRKKGPASSSSSSSVGSANASASHLQDGIADKKDL